MLTLDELKVFALTYAKINKPHNFLEMQEMIKNFNEDELLSLLSVGYLSEIDLLVRTRVYNFINEMVKLFEDTQDPSFDNLVNRWISTVEKMSKYKVILQKSKNQSTRRKYENRIAGLENRVKKMKDDVMKYAKQKKYSTNFLKKSIERAKKTGSPKMIDPSVMSRGKKIVSGVGIGIGVAVLIATLTTVAYKTYKNVLSAGARVCKDKKGKEKDLCIIKYQIKAELEKIKIYKNNLKKCNNTNNLEKCQKELWAKIIKCNNKIKKLKTKISTQRGYI
jgi:hypothetical protein